MILIFMLVAAVLSWGLCGLIRWLPLRDAPDGARKQQEAPVPTAGGIGILVAGVLCTLAFLRAYGDPAFVYLADLPELLVVLVLLLAPFLIGLADDWRGMPALVKLGLLLAWIMAVLAVLVDQAYILSPGVALAMGLVGLFLLVFVNAANFMDGSNGLAVGCLALMIASLFPLFIAAAYCQGECPGLQFVEPGAGLTIFVPAAAIGFLVWNMAGKLYAGDAGALGLGGLFCLLAILLLQALPSSMAVIWYVLTVTLPFTVDVLMTLALRTWQRKNILKAHTDHAYQRLRAAGWAHWKVAGLWWAMTLVCAGAAYAGVFFEFVKADENYVTGLNMAAFIALATTGAALWTAHRLVHMRSANSPG